MPVNEKLKQYEALMGEVWTNKLESFLLGDKYAVIKKKINDDLLARKAVTPKTVDMFNAFKYCPFDKVRVVIVGQNPYPEAGLATGIAFESGKHKMPAALGYIYDAIEKDIYGGLELNMERSKDLKYLCAQGVLLLNTELTTIVGQTQCEGTWRPFTEEVIRKLTEDSAGLIFCLWGREAQSYAHLINKNHHVFNYSHPTSAYYSAGKWDCKHFSEINQALKASNGDAGIIWDKYFYEQSLAPVAHEVEE